MSKRKQTPVFMVSEEFKGLTPRRYTTSTYIGNTNLGDGGKITCLPCNRIAFRLAMKIEGMTEKVGVFGHNFFNKKVRKDGS